MSETKINASQTTITAEDIGASSAVATMPTAAVGYLDKIVQYVGATDASYTNGYFYKCVSDGGNPATYSWTAVQVQASSGGLPSQSGNSGKFLTTDGTDPSWATISALQNTATGTNSLTVLGTATTKQDSINIGSTAEAKSDYSVAIGTMARAYGYSTNVAIGAVATAGRNNNSSDIGVIAIGANTNANGPYAIQLGFGVNSDAGTFKVGFGPNKNYELLSNNGTIPTDRFTTTPVADGTYVPTLTISSGTATRTWGAAASAPVVPATAPTLAVADWSSNTQTVSVQGVTSSNVVLVGPAPSSAQDYADAGILCTAQGTDSLTFTCTTVPSNAITLSVVIFG